MENAVQYPDERRKTERVLATNLVWYKVIPSNRDDRVPGEEGIEEGICKSFDLSKGGMGLHLTNPLPVGGIVFLEIITKKNTISALGKVVHSHELSDGNHRAGIRFDVVPPNDVSSLSEELTDR